MPGLENCSINHEKISGFSWELLPHPFYSTDIAPTDSHSFRSLHKFSPMKKLNSANEVQKEDFQLFCVAIRERFLKRCKTHRLHSSVWSGWDVALSRSDTRRCRNRGAAGTWSAASTPPNAGDGWLGTSGPTCTCTCRLSTGECLGAAPMTPGKQEAFTENRHFILSSSITPTEIFKYSHLE